MKRLHLECKPDEVLVRVLGHANKAIQHHNDKGRVCNYLMENEGLVAMIDEDPGSAQPTYLKRLPQAKGAYNVRIYYDEARNNKLVLLCPKLEDWIIGVCSKNNVEMKGLSNKPNSLHKEITSKLPQFGNLIKELLDKNVPEVIYLQEQLKSIRVDK